jgi:hypothetical protein
MQPKTEQAKGLVLEEERKIGLISLVIIFRMPDAYRDYGRKDS